MIIKSLDLSNFRLYKKKSLAFSPSATIIVGPNASGKTNLLEAIFLLSSGKSFRAESDREMIMFGEEISRVGVKMYQCNKEEVTSLEIVLTQGQVSGVKTPIKKYLVNGVGRRMLDFVGKLKSVLFWPQDLQLVTDSPSLRRRYLNFVLSQVDREYRRTLVSYEKGLRQRSRVLDSIREHNGGRHQLIFWDQLLIKNGNYITEKRDEYIRFVNNFKFQISNPKLASYQLIYDRSVISRARLDQYQEKEIMLGMTLVGPHRDDFKFQIVNNENKSTRDVSHFGSRGEQRLAILWLKLGELSYIEGTTGEKPLLLLDDILSELDHRHRRIIFELVKNQQTIITTTDPHLIEEKLMKKTEVIEL